MPRTEQRVRGGVHACQRCRRRKQKCDQGYPQCSNCQSVNTPCLSYHSGKQVDIPRDYISSLEEKIAKLTQEVQDLRDRRRGNASSEGSVATIATVSPSAHQTSKPFAEAQLTSGESSPLFQGLVTTVTNDFVGPSHQPRFLGESSGISFAKLVMSAIHVDHLSSPPAPEPQPFRGISPPTPDKASLPPRLVADHLVDVYFQYRTPHLPILCRSQVDKAINCAYNSLGGSRGSLEIPERGMFIAYMVFAIALVDVPHTSGGRSSQSEGCFRSALIWLEKILTYSKTDLETLRTVLLLTQFVALCPSRGNLWQLTGFALRLSIDVGLHWENESQCLNMDPAVLDERRRLWHSTYHFDRLLSITLGRPFGILDESIRVQLPNPWTGFRQILGQQQSSNFDIHIQRAHNHLFTLAKMESEIKHVQNSQAWTLKLAYPRPSWKAWLPDIQSRMQEWYATMPDPSKAHPSSIFAFQAYWDVIYYNAILLLYRPHSGTLYQSKDELFTCFDASCKVVAGLEVLQREGRVEMLWKSVHHLFMAGLGIIYGLWHSKEIRDQHPVDTCISTLHSCASTLSSMSKTFHGAVGCRLAFDTLCSATIDWLVTTDSEQVRQTRLQFENHVRELRNQLRLSQTNVHHGPDNISSMLSNDDFDLSELLNTAAQWPDLAEFNFDLDGQNTMADPTIML